MTSWTDDAPSWVALGATRQVARKDYPCSICGTRANPRIIPAGTKYSRMVGIEDGKVVVHRECFAGCEHYHKLMGGV